jgi:hypothetical protein
LSKYSYVEADTSFYEGLKRLFKLVKVVASDKLWKNREIYLRPLLAPVAYYYSFQFNWYFPLLGIYAAARGIV